MDILVTLKATSVVKLSALCVHKHSWTINDTVQLFMGYQNPKWDCYLIGRFPVAITESKNMSQDWEFVQIVKKEREREPKHVDISALDALFSFQKISFSGCHWCLNIPQYNLFISLKLSQICCVILLKRSLHNHSL